MRAVPGQPIDYRISCRIYCVYAAPGCRATSVGLSCIDRYYQAASPASLCWCRSAPVSSPGASPAEKIVTAIYFCQLSDLRTSPNRFFGLGTVGHLFLPHKKQTWLPARKPSSSPPDLGRATLSTTRPRLRRKLRRSWAPTPSLSTPWHSR